MAADTAKERTSNVANTYQYQPPDGSLGPVTPIDGNTLFGEAGSYSIHATGIAFIAKAADNVAYTPTSSFDLTIQPEGGYVSVAGNWNLSIGNSDQYTVNDSTAGDHNNMFVAGEPVSQLNVTLQPTDTMFIQGATQQDIADAFAHPIQTGYQEVLHINRAGGSPLTVDISDHHGLGAVMSQLHGF